MTQILDIAASAARETVSWYFEPLKRVIDVFRARRHGELDTSLRTDEPDTPVSERSVIADDTAIPIDSPDPLLDSVLPGTRYWRVAVHSRLDETAVMPRLSVSHAHTLMLLVMRLQYIAGDIEPGANNIREISQTKTILLQDGTEFAPLAVHFMLSDDVSTALVIDVEPLESDSVVVIDGTLASAIAMLGDLARTRDE